METAVHIQKQAELKRAIANLSRRQRRSEWVIRLVGVSLILALWEAFGRQINPLLFAPPSRIVAAAVQVVGSGELWKYLSISLKVFLIGTGLGAISGVVLGILMARIRVLDLTLEPFVIALYSTPMVALMPLVVIWLGFGDQAKAAVIYLFAIFPILLNTYQGVKSVDPKLLEVAKSFRSPEWALWGDVILPSSLPFLVAGLRLALGRALVGMVVADLYTAVSGIGYLIVRYAQSIQIDRMLVPVITLSLLGVILVQGLRWLEVRVAPWQHSSHD
ncbi:MAG: ABC transporter permease [Armatimonadota bacterium]|nr:ABC transporter permease [Armatimonadota bacterium]MDR5703519.1 ABC transporter permease [Armatimonadota bacterium]MDR7435014.1 ABC transporter permease [Armatimonadota bacterium]